MYWHSTESEFVLNLGQSERTFTEVDATLLFEALGDFLKQPTATLGVDEYTILERWNNLKQIGMVVGSIDLGQAREVFWAAMEGFMLETTKALDHIDRYLVEMSHARQRELS